MGGDLAAAIACEGQEIDEFAIVKGAMLTEIWEFRSSHSRTKNNSVNIQIHLSISIPFFSVSKSKLYPYQRRETEIYGEWTCPWILVSRSFRPGTERERERERERKSPSADGLGNGAGPESLRNSKLKLKLNQCWTFQ